MTRNIKQLGDRMTAMEEKIKEPTQIPKVLSSKIIFPKKYLSVPSFSVTATEQGFIISIAYLCKFFYSFLVSNIILKL